MTSHVGHPEDKMLELWISASDSDQCSDEIGRHVSRCKQCQRRAAELRALRSATRETIEFETACAGSSDATVTIKGLEPPSDSDVRGVRIHRRSFAAQQPGCDASDYGLLNAIGEGGMGVVYRAHQTSMDRSVAVKMLKGEARDKERIGRENRFLQEALITGDLDHPNIVPVHELGSNDSEVLFYSMKYVQGTCWGDAIYSKTEAENVEILMRVADAVAFAHSRGVIHRDIKPENVMLGRFGEVWLMDWGLAFPTSDFAKPVVSKSLRVGGTPVYMAPEMTVADGQISVATDVYLLGAVLYQIVTGSPPHAGESVMSCVLAARQNKIVSTNVRSGLRTIAERAMRTDPEDRYACVPDFQEAVRNWIKHDDTLKIAENARRLLGNAAEKQDYDDFVRAIFGFEQACALFPENDDFSSSLSDAKLEYARCAERKGDFDLALSLLDNDLSEHVEARERVLNKKRVQESKSKQLHFQKRALQSLIAITLLLIVGGVAVAQWLRSNALHLANTNEPAMHASLSLQSGVRRSLSALRGWVALGEQGFKQDRSSAWLDEINPSLKRLQQVTDRSGTPDDRQQLNELKAALEQLHETQWWIEDVAQTPGNEPARHLLLRDLSPIEVRIALAIESLIDLHQAQIPGAKSQSTWVMLSDLQMEFATCDRSLRTFVDKGDTVSRHRCELGVSSISEMLQNVAKTTAFDDQQQQILAWLIDEFDAYRAISEEIIRIRQSEQANVAQQRLKREAIPISNRTEALLSKIVARNRESTIKNSLQINRVSVIALSIGFALAIGVVAFILVLLTRSVAARRLGAAACLMGMASVAVAQEAKSDRQLDLEMVDVYAPVEQVLREIDLIRIEMGKPKYVIEELRISHVFPHEIYFQSLTLFRKTDQLCFELIRSRVRPPKPPESKIQPADVLRVIEAVHQRLQALKEELEIDESVQDSKHSPTRTATDVFYAIVEANRQLNIMLEKKFAPSDAYQQVTLAVSYCSELLSSFSDATRLPEPPPFESGKTPPDVAHRLNQCFVKIRKIAAMSGVDMLRVDETKPATYEEVDPSDVYDLASLLVSELDYLHSLRGDLRRPRRVFAPGRIFPSHAYQRAGMLDIQLAELEKLVEANPDWLKSVNRNAER